MRVCFILVFVDLFECKDTPIGERTIAKAAGRFQHLLLVIFEAKDWLSP